MNKTYITLIQVYTFGCNDEYALGRDNDEDIEKVALPEKCVEKRTKGPNPETRSRHGRVVQRES